MRNPKSTSTERTRRYRARLSDQGFANISVAVDASTARILRSIAREHGQSMADVIKVGAALTHRALAGSPSPAATE